MKARSEIRPVDVRHIQTELRRLHRLMGHELQQHGDQGRHNPIGISMDLVNTAADILDTAMRIYVPFSII